MLPPLPVAFSTTTDLPQAGGELLRQHARGDVGRAAGRKADQDADRPVRIVGLRAAPAPPRAARTARRRRSTIAFIRRLSWRHCCHSIPADRPQQATVERSRRSPIFAADVFPFRAIPETDGHAGASGAAGRAACVPVAFCAAGEAAVHRAVRRRVLRGADRRGRPLVHGADRHLSCRRSRPIASWPRPGRGWSAWRWSCVVARPARRARALSHHQPGDRGAVHRPDPLAGALARRAPELGVLPERFRRPHLQPRDADRPGGAADAGHLGHRGLVRAGLRHHRRGDDGRGRRLARRCRSSAGSPATSRCCGTSCRACATAPRSIRRRARR